MNRRSKRGICILLAICMMFGVVSMGVFATSPQPLPFTDVTQDAWYRPAVAHAHQNNMMQGTSSTTFEPNATMSRAMAVATLFRLEHGRMAAWDDIRADFIFADVSPSAWYSPYATWAYGVGITDGVGDSYFAPHDKVTREQFATMLHRYAWSTHTWSAHLPDTSFESFRWFPDIDQISDWALDFMFLAYKYHIIRGTDAGTLNPQGYTTRAETATLLMRLSSPEQTENVDIKLVLGRNFYAVRHLFGNLTSLGEDPIHRFFRVFDTGLFVRYGTAGWLDDGTLVTNNYIKSIFVDYGQTDDLTFYHFDGIDGTSTYDDVIKMFGDQPDNIREGGMDEELVGAIVSYGYWVVDMSAFVRIFFDADDAVVAISFFCAEMPVNVIG